MRTRLVAVGAAVVLALAGCMGEDADAHRAMPAVQVVQPPAASAGGACILWDYDMIERRLGLRFDVAAAGQVDDTSTCVVQNQLNSLPDLLLSVVERTDADPALYAQVMVPARAKPVNGLGKAAYRLVTHGDGRHGPAVEVGWFTADRQVFTLRLTLGADAGLSETGDLADALVAVANELSQDSARTQPGLG